MWYADSVKSMKDNFVGEVKKTGRKASFGYKFNKTHFIVREKSEITLNLKNLLYHV